MKAWIALPKGFLDGGIGGHGYVNTAAICPPLTMDMKEDHLAWFEVDVTRRIEQEVTMPKFGNWPGVKRW